MKTTRLLQSCCFLSMILIAVLIPGLARGQVIIVNFDESGSGVAIGALFPNMPGTMSPDTTNGVLTLTYHLVASVGTPAIPGDVQISEPSAGGPTVLSDLLRFDPNGLLFVYSDTEAGETPPALTADVGLPANAQADPYNNSILLPETGVAPNPYSEFANGAFNYLPTPGQPGFIPGFQTFYNFTSDLPEPGALSLLALASAGLTARRRKIN